MAIKYYSIPEKRQTIAVLSNTKWDAYNRIDKIMADTGFLFSACCPNSRDKYIMPDTFKVVVTCDPRDEFDIEVGKQVAKKRLMRNYYKSLDKRLGMFKKSVEDFTHKISR